jgi:hypothetical protein
MPSTVPSSEAQRASTRNTVTFTTGTALTTFVPPRASIRRSRVRSSSYPFRSTFHLKSITYGTFKKYF